MPLCPICKKDAMTPYMGLQFGKYICKNCGYVGVLVLEKEENKKAKNIEYFNKWAPKYDRFIFGWWLRSVQDRVLGELKLKSNTNVLDIGCGTGYLLLRLSEKITKGKLVGLDISSEMIAQAKKKLHGIKNVRLYLADAEKIPYKNKTFDYVISTEAFHHFPQPRLVLKEIRRVLKSNGKLALADINFPPLFLNNVLFRLEPGFVRMYSKKGFVGLFMKNGFQVIKQKRIGLVGIFTIAKKA